MKKLLLTLVAGSTLASTGATAAPGDFDVTVNVVDKCTLQVRDAFLGELVIGETEDSSALAGNVGFTCGAAALLGDVHIGLSNNGALGQTEFTNGTATFKAAMHKPNAVAVAAAVGVTAAVVPFVAAPAATLCSGTTNTGGAWGPTGTDRLTVTVGATALATTSWMPVCYVVAKGDITVADTDTKIDTDAAYAAADTSAAGIGKYKADITATLEF